MVSYEGLVLNTELEMKRVMKFLGKEFDPDMLNHSTKLTNKNVTLAPNGMTSSDDS